ncbi:hypothetical protein K431DRAFT_225285 [Polychaeton citri CBS 116435]|uniref:Zn(2)-C6 fungal-type domain-containing protein n=1 Tax=Polychaeton citri CBS 116435 TaxID=1314669 RepID=A0A9P4Q5H7_9PEZI|nr:hypothetical protein K431DRAFT_225285 [Polychaeton citri CBS 116435]
MTEEAVADAVVASTESGKRRSQSCKQCRARKRLEFRCSFIDNTWEFPTSGEDGASPHELTQGGTKRRRILKACQACHALKAKCSGEEPCNRCRQHKHECVYLPSQRDRTRLPGGVDVSHRPYPTRVDPTPEVTMHGRGVERMSVEVSTPGTSASELPRCVDDLKVTIRSYIDTYFEQVDPVSCVFLHKASLLSDLNKGVVDPMLLKALCAYGARLQSARHDNDSLSASWMRQVESYLLSRLQDRSLVQLQTMMLLIHYRYNSENLDNVWMLLALASRLAFAKRLNIERPSAPPVEQESNRRLMWSIWLLDRLFSGGVEDLAVAPAAKIYLRLPCNERCFSYGVPSKTQFLAPREEDDGRDMGVLAYMIRVIEIRDKILRYTKRVIIEDSSPWNTETTLRQLAGELQAFRKSLPEELQLNPQNLTFRAHSPHLTGFVMLHTYYYQCHSDLYRILIPGIRESVSHASLAATPQQFVEYCQQQCLKSATALVNFWSDVYHLDARKPIDDCCFAVSAYQCAQILHNLSDRLEENSGHTPEYWRRKLMQTLEMLSALRNSYPIVRGCISDIERIVSKFGSHTPPLQSPEQGRSVIPLDTSGQERKADVI